MQNLYATIALVKDRLSIPDTLDDTDILAALGAVSRQIDRYCGRPFYVELRTRYFTARCGEYVRVPDLLAVTTLQTDRNGDRTYSDTWTSSDYELEPVNAPYESPPEAYSHIYAAPYGDYSFPAGVRRGCKVVGKYGPFEVLETVSATAAEALDTSETGVDVSDGSAFEVGQTLLIDSEQMFITAISGDTLTVERAVNGTTAASHSNGATIQRYTYPIISEAAAEQTILVFRGYTAPFGEIGGNTAYIADWRQAIGAGLHPFVKNMLETFRRAEYG